MDHPREILVADRFPALRVKLLDLLAGLSGDDWDRPTAARQLWDMIPITPRLSRLLRIVRRRYYCSKFGCLPATVAAGLLSGDRLASVPTLRHYARQAGHSCKTAGSLAHLRPVPKSRRCFRNLGASTDLLPAVSSVFHKSRGSLVDGRSSRVASVAIAIRFDFR